MEFIDGSTSVFPGKIDEFPKLSNLQIESYKKMERYKKLKVKTNLTQVEMNELNDLTEELQHHMISVETWNKFADGVVKVQKFFTQEVDTYIDDLQRETEEFATTKKNKMTDFANITKADVNSYTRIKKEEIDGQALSVKNKADSTKTSIENYSNATKNAINKYIDDKQDEIDYTVETMSYRGVWSPSTQYYKNNTVTFNGRGYIALKDNRNIQVSDTTVWSLFTVKGDKGDTGTSITYRGDFNLTREYVLGDSVVYEGLWYYAKTKTKGNYPQDSEFWELQSNQIQIGGDEPTDVRIPIWVDFETGWAKYYNGARRVPITTNELVEGDLSFKPTDIKKAQTDITKLEGRATGLESRTTAVENRSTALESETTELTDDLRLITGRTSVIEEDLVDVNRRLNKKITWGELKTV